MKKLFFLCAFLFVSIEMQAQLYIVKPYTSAEPIDENNLLAGYIYTYYITISAPDGSVSTTEILTEEIVSPSNPSYLVSTPENIEFFTQAIHAELTTIINQGYELIHIVDNITTQSFYNSVYYLAVPWTIVGLTEIDSSELDFRISPNPAKEYINVEVDFTSQPTELVLISEGGYVYFKKDISNIISGQEFTLDISNVPAGKYLVTIQNANQYLAPKKLIIF